MVAVFAAVTALHIALAWGYKVKSNEAKQVPRFCDLADADVTCAEMLQEVKCHTSWAAACPGIDHPMGEEFNSETFATRCEEECKVTTKVPLSQMSEDDPKLEPAHQRANCLMQMVEEAELQGHDTKAKKYAALVAGELGEDLKKVASLTDDDEEIIEASVLAGKEVAANLVKDMLKTETETVMGSVKLSDAAIKKYTDSLEEVATTCGDVVESESIKEKEGLLLKHSQAKGQTHDDLHQLMDEELYLNRKCASDRMNLNHFVQELVVKEGTAACGSSLLQSAHQKTADEMSHRLEIEAKQVLALHTKENELGHHFVQHVLAVQRQDHLHPEFKSFHAKYMEVMSGNFSQGQLTRLHHLEQHHPHWQKARAELGCDIDSNVGYLKEYKRCVCNAKEPSLVCKMRHSSELKAQTKYVRQLLQDAKSSHTTARSTRGEVAPVALSREAQASNLSASLGHHMVKGKMLLPCGISSKKIASGKWSWGEFLSGQACVQGKCIGLPPPPGTEASDPWYKQVQGALGVFGYIRNLMGQPAIKATPPPCISASCTSCVGVNGDLVKFKFTLGGQVADCGTGRAVMSTFSLSLAANMCLGVPGLEDILKLFGYDCVTIGAVHYFPFIGKLTISDTAEVGSWTLWGQLFRFKTNFNFPVHDLTLPVTQHCNLAHRSPWFTDFRYAYWKIRRGHSYACGKVPTATFCSVSSREQACLDEYRESQGDKELTIVVEEYDEIEDKDDCWRVFLWGWHTWCGKKGVWNPYTDYQFDL